MTQARLALRTLGDQLAVEFPGDNDGRGIAVESIAGVVSPGARATLHRQWTILNALAALVLLVVCFNVANMLMVRAAARAPEMALRRALGAGRLRLIRQLLAEHIVFALSGGAGGALLAWWASAMGAALVPQSLLNSFAGTFAPDWRLFAFGATIVLASSVISSVPAAWAAARVHAGSLASGGAGTRMTAPGRLRAALAVLQVALSLALLVSGTLLGRSLLEAGRVDLGFQPSGVVTAYFDLDAAGYTPEAGANLHRELLHRASTWSGVESVSLGAHVPLRGASLGLPIEIMSANAAPPSTRLVRMNVIAPNFFRALRTPVLRGREFLPTDVDAAPPVALVNETCRLQCFGGEDPLGRRIRLFQEDAPREIVGVVADSKYAQPLEDVRPTVFVPVAQHYWPRMALLVRTATPDAFVRMLPDEIRRLDPALPLDDVRTLEQRLDLALWQTRMISSVVAGFGLLSLILAGLGVYGVTAQTTEHRAPEIAVRMALGAAPAAIVSLVLRLSLGLVAIGGALGVALALAMSGALQAFLYRVDALDPLSFVVAIIVLGSVAVTACWIPARRAAAADPAAILRR
jgi:predicted permease